jgi:replicative DNA helicase
MSEQLIPNMRFNLEAEQSVLGSVLINPNCFVLIQPHVSSGDFYQPEHQAIFSIMQSFSANHKAIDPLIVAQELEAQKVFDNAAAWQYLVQLAITTPSAANAIEYAKIVRDKSIRRKAIEMCEGMIRRLENGETHERAAELAGNVLQLLSGLI